MKIDSEILIAIVIGITFCFLVNKSILEGYGEVKYCTSDNVNYKTEYMPVNMDLLYTPKKPTCDEIASNDDPNYRMMIYPPNDQGGHSIFPLSITGGFGLGVPKQLEEDICKCYGCDFDWGLFHNTCKERK